MKLNIPFVGIVSKEGYTESYDYKKAEKYDFHHDYIMSQKALQSFDYDKTLRFTYNKKDDAYKLEGVPSLDPFGKGSKQIKKFINHISKKGANPKTRIMIEDQRLNTPYEGTTIGTVENIKLRLR